ncbi:GumC family protein [Paracoccus siganidrum]|uniref:Polysaccharide chain length determinant N-terminal domain-containing protein n=1 Tax=Paracoccus siganidrum TaxID=1276757 RepID=A0A418ZW45_9RHOB|nr:exopolysaccharide transport family protein [Paracoccus siganidrum]RJL04106.1 hypothetical protein D3P05_20790 [Paracoccus siganidrum]RMC33098.1 hypothetical protein C9E82_14240 [Paracoccus siganidrum]
MIQNDPPLRHPARMQRDDAVPDVDLGATLRALRGGLRRQWPVIAAMVLLLSALTMAHLLVAQPKYTARAALIVDPRISNSVNGPEAPTLLLSDALVVDSELEVLSSREVTGRVAASLGLFEAAEEAAPPGPLGRVLTALGELRDRLAGGPEAPLLQGEDAEAGRREAIRRKMMEGFDITRAGGTYAIQIAYTDADPLFATRAVNALIEEYFTVSSDASLSDTRRISAWLDQRVAVLGGEVEAADRAVADYRRENDLFAMRDDLLPSEAELSAANDRLIGLRSRLIDLQTAEDRIAAILTSDSVAPLLDGTLGGEVASPALREMQTRFSRLIGDEGELVGRWGADSDIVARNRQDQAQLHRLMLEEARQIAERIRSQRDAVGSQIAATGQQIEILRERASLDAQKSIRLRELEREAQAKRRQYESMLGQMVLATQNETFQRAPARIIARAVPPDEKSWPKGKRLLALAVFGGLVLGAGIGFLREVTDNRLRRIGELRDGLGLRYLGVLSPVSPRRVRPAQSASLRGLAAELRQRRPEQGGLVCGLASAFRGEGAPVVAGWLAAELAGDGRVALLDLDGAGDLAPLLPGNVAVQQLTSVEDPQAIATRLAALAEEGRPVAVLLHQRGAGPELLVRRRLQALVALIAEMRGRFDQVIVLLPPLDEAARTELAAELVDCAILVVRWGRSDLPELSQALTDAAALRPKLLGGLFATDGMRGFRRYN